MLVSLNKSISPFKLKINKNRPKNSYTKLVKIQLTQIFKETEMVKK